MNRKFQFIRLLSKTHGYIYRFSRGKIGNRLGTLEILLLTTTGRITGRPRSVPLLAIPYGDNYVLVASFGGSPVNPNWFENIKQSPYVLIRVGPIVKRAKASVIEPTDADYERLWGAATTIYDGFNHYKRLTLRPIPVVLIEPDEVRSLRR
jgi:deazaflavin-dependent oxidoreductase (nitroreductase family)